MQFRANLGVGKHHEAEVRIEGAIPRNVGEGRQSHGGSSCVLRPGSNAFDECAPNTDALVRGIDADLLDVSAAVDLIYKHVADGTVSFIDRDPATSGHRVPREVFGGSGLFVGDVIETDFSEAFPGAALDQAQHHRIIGVGCTNDDDHD